MKKKIDYVDIALSTWDGKLKVGSCYASNRSTKLYYTKHGATLAQANNTLSRLGLKLIKLA